MMLLQRAGKSCHFFFCRLAMPPPSLPARRLRLFSAFVYARYRRFQSLIAAARTMTMAAERARRRGAEDAWCAMLRGTGSMQCAQRCAASARCD